MDPRGQAAHATELAGRRSTAVHLVFHAGTGVLLGVHAIGEIASEITGTGQAMIHNQATVEDVIRTACNTPTYTYGYKLAASDVLAQLHPDVLRAMRLPSRAHRI